MFWNKKRRPAESPAANPTGKHVAAELWSRKAAEMVHSPDWSRNLWQSHPITQRHIQRAMSGDPETNWLTYVRDRYCPRPFERGLSLGCGNGAAERDAITLGICQQMEGMDLSPGAIEVAQQEAVRTNLADRITYFTGDMDNLDLPENRYDVIIAGQSVHHVQNLESLAEALHRTMKPRGILILNEYVGPSQYQWTDKVDRLMNDLLALLPPEKRLRQNGTLKEAVLRPTPEQVAAVDPTESVRSAEILPVFSRHFDFDYRANFGGTLLQHLLSEIIANFSEHNPMDRALIDALVLFEDTLIQENAIESDFVFGVMHPH